MALDDVAASPWAEMLAGAATVQQQAIERLEVPLLIMDVPTRRIRAANAALGELFGVRPEELIGLRNVEAVQFDDVEGIEQAVDALTTGAIDGYRAHRRLTARDGTARDVLVWGRLFDFDDRRYAAYLLSPLRSEPGLPGAAPPYAWVGPLVLGRAEADWRITCLTTDVRDLLGGEPCDYVQRRLLDLVHPDDVARLLEVRPADDGNRGVITMRHVRIRHHDGHWVAVQCLFVCLDDDRQPDLAFALLPAPPQPGPAADRVAEMELRLRRIAAELRAVGMMDGIDSLPSAADFPQITGLSSRQWQILARLLRGERVPAMARELHVSPSTLRNHLSDMFMRFGVHSQAELIALLRRR